MDFTVDSIPVKSVMKFIMKSGNKIHSKIHDNPKAHNEKHMLYIKSGMYAFHLSGAFHVLFTFKVFFHVLFTFQVLLTFQVCFSGKVLLFMKTNKTRLICGYTCTVYKYMYHMHHQVPLKYNIYLVGLPSVLYERPCQNKRFVLNQLFLLLFRCFSCAFNKKCHFSYKSTSFHENTQNQVNMVYIHVPFTHTCTTCTTKYHQNITYT